MLVGHRIVINSLVSAWEVGSLAHALLFFGMGGVGKKKIALALAKTILCRVRPVWNGCGVCEDCRSCDKENHPLLFHIGGNEEIGISSIRQLHHFLSLSVPQARVKISIIDNAHRLSTEAANALLKLLEEPPESSLIILVSAHKERLPKTILSRLTPYFFGCLSKSDMAVFCQKKDILALTKLEENALMLAQGRPGLFVRLMGDQAFLDELLGFRQKMRAVFQKKAFFSWEEFEKLSIGDFEEKLDFVMQFYEEWLREELGRNGNDLKLQFWLELGRAMFLRKRSETQYNLNSRIAWESLMTHF